MENNSNQSGKNVTQAYRVAYLVAGFIREQLTITERDELDQWILASEENMQLFSELIDEKNIASSLAAFDKIDVEKKLAETKEHINFNEKTERAYSWWFAAAAIVLLITGFWWINNRQDTSLQTESREYSAINDISPGFPQAVLLRGNGSQQLLETGKTDTVLPGALQLNRSKGELIYNHGKPGAIIEIHRIVVPRKGSFTVVLPDGTRVKLNAESSLEYPTVFNGETRTIKLAGEAYFEVAKDKTKPFRVHVGGTVVEAVGTAFNINAYSEEESIKTCLVEGVIRVTAGTTEKFLQPGQMAELKKSVLHVRDFDKEEVLAWTENNFVFRNAPIKEIMNQVKRWYDAEIVYNDSINFHLNATIKRDLPVSELLQLLEQTGHAHFKVENNRIYISK